MFTAPTDPTPEETEAQQEADVLASFREFIAATRDAERADARLVQARIQLKQALDRSKHFEDHSTPFVVDGLVVDQGPDGVFRVREPVRLATPPASLRRWFDRPDVARVMETAAHSGIARQRFELGLLEMALDLAAGDDPDAKTFSIARFEVMPLPDKVAALIDTGIPRYSAEGLVRWIEQEVTREDLTAQQAADNGV